jgi:hypothetical protein
LVLLSGAPYKNNPKYLEKQDIGIENVDDDIISLKWKYFLGFTAIMKREEV